MGDLRDFFRISAQIRVPDVRMDAASITTAFGDRLFIASRAAAPLGTDSTWNPFLESPDKKDGRSARLPSINKINGFIGW